MRLASEHGCVSTTGTEVGGADGKLVKKSVIDAAVAANELVLINTEGVSSLFAKCVMRDVTGSGSGSTKPTIRFYGFVASGQANEADKLDNPFMAVQTEQYKNTIVSGNVTGVSDNPVVRSTTGNEFFSHHDWNNSSVASGAIVVVNSNQVSNAPAGTVSMITISDVANVDDDGSFVFVNSAGLFDMFGFTFNKGSLSTAIANLYYAPIYH
jgi:hypothetical protein